MTGIEIINDHDCGYIYEVYQNKEDKEWYFKKSKYAESFIINFCPMCGKKLNERYYYRDTDDGI